MLEGIGENFGLGGNPLRKPVAAEYLRLLRQIDRPAGNAGSDKMRGGTVSGLAGGAAAC